MKTKTKIFLSMMLSLIFVLAACSNDSSSNEKKAGDGPLKVISSFTIIQNMLEEIGDDHVEVHNLVPSGTDPHEYEPKPDDIKAVTDADVLFYNGLNLEGGDAGWLSKLTNSVGMEEDQMIEVAKEVEPMYLKDEKGQQETNPHAFINPKVGIIMAESIRDNLVKIDPDNEADYKKNADEYIGKLKEIEQRYKEEFGAIPDDNRILVAGEYAFQYMTAEYDIKEGYIWAIDTDDNGTPEQIKEAVKFVKENKPKYLFVESNVDRRPMETVSKETGVPIFEEVIYADEIGNKGDPVDTYIKFLETNLENMTSGMK